jgi:hypothetical protein
MGRIREQSLGVAALLLAIMCAACANDAAQMEQSIEDAVYVLPTEIPSGWTVGVATQRIELGELPDGEVVSSSRSEWNAASSSSAQTASTTVSSDGSQRA